MIFVRRKKKPKMKTSCKRFFRSIKDMLWIPGLERRCLLMPLSFLVVYYVGQVLYQTDKLCFGSGFGFAQITNRTIEQVANHTYNERNHTDTFAVHCRHKNAERFKKWSEHLGKLTGILTFLLGFYVANMVRRWQTQVADLLNFTFFK